MPARALIERRPWLLASLIAGLSFWLVKDSAVPGLYRIAWKAAGIGLLVPYALLRHRGPDSRALAAVMAAGALGDALIELSLTAGALAFLLGHVIAIRLYWRHRRRPLAPSQRGLGLALLLLVPLVAFALPADRALAGGVALYAAGLGAMAASAWTSTFPRYRVGIGAVLFAASDLLIFARLGPLASSAIPGALIWPLYYFGQLLIATGVMGEIGARAQAAGSAASP